MAAPAAFQALTMPTVNGASANGASYWWKTSGLDLARMLQEANYPEDAQRHFLEFFRDTICPALGNAPDATAVRSGVGWDGNPFEYSFELKGSAASMKVRFVVDLSQLRPADPENPLSMAATQRVVDVLATKTPGFDDTWYRALKKWYDHTDLPSSEQQAIVAKAGYQTPVILGFDINPSISAGIPVMAKAYFPPSFAAVAKNVTPWKVISTAIRDLPNIELFPNILRSLEVIEDWLSTKPKEREHDCRFLACDFIAPGKARIKIYMRYSRESFEEIWDYYTLGGRLTGYDDDKDAFRDLVDLTSGNTDEDRRQLLDDPNYTKVGRKMTAFYFSLSPDSPYPTPKFTPYPGNFAPNDEAIAQGLDTWLNKNGWADGGKPIEEKLKKVFTHRELSEKKGIMTFIGIGRKEDASKKGLSVQVYVTPELYLTPRIQEERNKH